MYSRLTNGVTNGQTAQDCDFTCAGGYKYRNTGSTRSCTACGIGYYTNAGNQSTSCSACTNKPAASTYTSRGNGNNCRWNCNDGYTKSSDGSACVKWEIGTWSSCTPECDSTCTETRSVRCVDGGGSLIAD